MGREFTQPMDHLISQFLFFAGEWHCNWRHAKIPANPLKEDEEREAGVDKHQEGIVQIEKRERETRGKGGPAPIADDILALYNLRRMVRSLDTNLV